MSERYLPNRDQVALARSLGASLGSILPLSRLKESHEESAETWTALADLGVMGISVPEEQGGSGLGATEEALIVIELGRRVVAPSVLSTLGAAHLRSVDKRFPAEGRRRVAAGYSRGDRVVFVEDSGANLLLVRDEWDARLFAIPGSSRVIDERLWSIRLLDTARLGDPLGDAELAGAQRLRLIDAAALAGLARAALEMAVEYAGVREQFGRPIGSFQAVKHHCANMALAARCACDQVSFAAVAVDDDRDDAALQVESAFFVAGSAAIENCGKNIQVHGGIGFSEEAAPHRLLKRARILLQIAGGLEAALIRIGDCPPAVSSRRAIEEIAARSRSE
jgi:alkylation response protein AidB-like acyl-CoA dehydrogenase